MELSPAGGQSQVVSAHWWLMSSFSPTSASSPSLQSFSL